MGAEPTRRSGIAAGMSRKSLWTILFAAACIGFFAYAFAINLG